MHWLSREEWQLERRHTSNMEFYREYLGMPYEPTEEERGLAKLAQEYRERTDAFDEKMQADLSRELGCPIESTWMMLHGICARHAQAVRQELENRAQALGFGPRDLFKAIHDCRKR